MRNKPKLDPNRKYLINLTISELDMIGMGLDLLRIQSESVDLTEFGEIGAVGKSALIDRIVRIKADIVNQFKGTVTHQGKPRLV